MVSRLIGMSVGRVKLWDYQDNPNVHNFISWSRTLPYAQELIFIDELKEEMEE